MYCILSLLFQCKYTIFQCRYTKSYHWTTLHNQQLVVLRSFPLVLWLSLKLLCLSKGQFPSNTVVYSLVSDHECSSLHLHITENNMFHAHIGYSALLNLIQHCLKLVHYSTTQKNLNKIQYVKPTCKINHYLSSRVLLSKALSCDRLPKEIWCS